MADNGDDVDEIDGFNRFGVDLLVSGTVLFAAVISEFSPTRTLHAGFDHVKTFDPNLLAHNRVSVIFFFFLVDVGLCSSTPGVRQQ